MVVVYLLLYQYKNKDELNSDLCIHNKYVIDNNVQYAIHVYIIVKMADVKKPKPPVTSGFNSVLQEIYFTT